MYTYPTAGTELDNIADILRRAHLEDGVPWGEMAVLVRAGGRTIPSVRRALTVGRGPPGHRRRRPAPAPRTGGGPAADGAAGGGHGGGGSRRRTATHRRAGRVPRRRADAAAGRPTPRPDGRPTPWLDTETALTLLASPLGGMDAADLRRLGRALRDEERAAGNPVPPPSDVLLAARARRARAARRARPRVRARRPAARRAAAQGP